MFKTFSITAALVLGACVGAEAACSTSSLAGNWELGSAIGACSIKISTSGVVSGTCGGFPVSGKLTLFPGSCKVTGTIMGETITGRTEIIDATSSAKPNLLLGSTQGDLGPVAAYRR